MPIIPNVDLCRGYMFYGLGTHVVYANLNAAQIHKKMLIMTAVVLILKVNTLSRRGYYRVDNVTRNTRIRFYV